MLIEAHATRPQASDIKQMQLVKQAGKSRKGFLKPSAAAVMLICHDPESVPAVL